MILTEVRNYLDEVRAYLHLPINTERQVISELYTHFQERVAELQQGCGAGLSVAADRGVVTRR